MQEVVDPASTTIHYTQNPQEQKKEAEQQPTSADLIASELDINDTMITALPELLGD